MMQRTQGTKSGLNPECGFPLIFTEFAEELGWYTGYEEAAVSIAERYPVSLYPEVLDICCGPGHFAFLLSRVGYQVSGVDLAKDQIAFAKSKYPGVIFFEGDMSSLPNTQYDMLTCVYTSFGYLESKAADMALLTHWQSRLRTGGRFIFEISDLQRLRAVLNTDTTLQRKVGNTSECLSFDRQTKILTNRYVRDDGAEWSCRTRLYEPEEITQGLKDAGFDDIVECGGFDGRKREADDKLVIFATRR